MVLRRGQNLGVAVESAPIEPMAAVGTSLNTPRARTVVASNGISEFSLDAGPRNVGAAATSRPGLAMSGTGPEYAPTVS